MTEAVKKGRGGARPGAGRKPKPKVPPVLIAPVGSLDGESEGEPVVTGKLDMLQLLQAVALGRVDASPLQVRAAIAAVQYTHTRRSDGGKKEETAEKAKQAASKFAQAAPPKLAAVGGKSV